jgi:hypothetical protein
MGYNNMCTAGFWKDNKGNIHYFKNRNLMKMPKEQSILKSDEGIFITDEYGKFEGMNKSGLFFVGLTLKSNSKEKNKRKSDISKDILCNFNNAIEALSYFIEENKKYDFSFTKILGDNKNVFLIEVSPNNFSYTDLSNAPYFVSTNHGQLLLNEGYVDDGSNSSHLRLLDAQEKIKNVKKYEDLKSILCSHKNGKNKNAICCHKSPGLTVSAYLFTPCKLQAEICINGQPCEKGFEKYFL